MSGFLRRYRGQLQRQDNATYERNSVAAYWEINGYDRYGKPTVKQAIELCVRIEKGLVESLQANGNPVSVPMLICVDRPLKIGSLLWIGVLNPLIPPTSDFLQIHEYEEIPDVKGREFDRWVKCMKYSDELPEFVRVRTQP